MSVVIPRKFLLVACNKSQRGADYDRALESTYRLYASLSPRANADPDKQGIDLDALRASLATKLTRFISLRDVTAEDVVRDAQRFYQRKADVKYPVHLDTFTVAREGDAVLATFAVDYAWVDHDLNVPDDEAEKLTTLTRGKRVETSARVTFDSAFRIVGYSEKVALRKKLKVVAPTWGTVRLADVVRTIANGDLAANVPRTRIPKGTILESDFEYVANAVGGSFAADDRFGPAPRRPRAALPATREARAHR
jgi:hypothetical protein